VTSETRPPRVGVAVATSTSREAPCAPVSTTSSSHCTSPSTSCWDPTQDAGVPAASHGCRMPNWSAWRWPRCCWAATTSTAGCGSATAGWGICSPICPTSPATTSDCAKPAGCWTRSWPTWPARPRRPRHPQAAGRHPGPLRRLADHAPALGAARHRRLRLVSQPLALVLGLKLYVLTTPTAARSPGAWPAPSWASARSPWRCWTEAASSPAKSSSSTRAWPAPRSTGTWPTGGGPGPPRPPR
jgi:hypothetical protein